MSEAELQRLITCACANIGLLYYHTHDSRRSVPGFPDLVITGRGGVLFRELKSAYGRLTPEQRRWGSTLARAGSDWSTWRPVDWEGGLIVHELLAIREAR
jgi:hypothetical protein